MQKFAEFPYSHREIVRVSYLIIKISYEIISYRYDLQINLLDSYMRCRPGVPYRHKGCVNFGLGTTEDDPTLGRSKLVQRCPVFGQPSRAGQGRRLRRLTFRLEEGAAGG
jgi:hypothetical protein